MGLKNKVGSTDSRVSDHTVSGSSIVTPPLIELRGVSKNYGFVTAVSNVDLQLNKGEVLALVGDNGAGKSTLVKILAGFHQPDSGQIIISGRHTVFNDPADAHKEGVATVFQNLALVEALDVARNMFLGREPKKFGLVARKEMTVEAEKVFSTLDIKIPSMKSAVAMLSGGQRQGIAIARAVMRGGRAVLMDEPTAALGVRETSQVLSIIKELRSQGRGIVLVSHNLEFVFAVSDRIQVLRLGSTAAVLETVATTRSEVVGLMTGGFGTKAFGFSK